MKKRKPTGYYNPDRLKARLKDLALIVLSSLFELRTRTKNRMKRTIDYDAGSTRFVMMIKTPEGNFKVR
ncbi:MAG: hypothetical protein ACSLFH_00210 [Desulfuromonadales bacterium]